jgi:hypothetical protein
MACRSGAASVVILLHVLQSALQGRNTLDHSTKTLDRAILHAGHQDPKLIGALFCDLSYVNFYQ